MADKSSKQSGTRRFGKIGGAAIGSAMAGVDGALFRDQPPPIEVVEHNRHDGPLVTADGSLLITLPEDDPTARE